MSCWTSRAVWRQRGTVEADSWRLHFVVVLDGRAVGEQALGYVPKGTDWATRQGDLALVNRWRFTRDTWERQRRGDIQLLNIDACHALLPLT